MVLSGPCPGLDGNGDTTPSPGKGDQLHVYSCHPGHVTVHTVVSFVFAMTIQPMWHSAIFGPYFVVGAIFSGVAAVIVVMALIRKVLPSRRLYQAGPLQ